MSVRERKAFLADDPRIMPRRDTRVAGDFKALVDDMVEDRLISFPMVEGDRNAGWLTRKVAQVSPGGFMPRHHRWVVETPIEQGAPTRHEHKTDMRIADLAVTVDGLNIMNLACFEYMFRRTQLIEEVHAENPKQPSFEGSEHYMGSEERPGGALVAPSLRKFVAESLGREAAILKEKRKARESRGRGKAG